MATNRIGRRRKKTHDVYCNQPRQRLKYKLQSGKVFP